MTAYRIVLAILFVTFAALQQEALAATEFDVVSIHPVLPGSSPAIREVSFTPVLPRGQYIDAHTNLMSMIAFAYNAKNPEKQLLGLPGWARNQIFAVAAKPAPDFPTLGPAENEEQVRLMMRVMLTDRFHLRLHTETRKEPIFNLEVAKGGIKIEEVDPPVPPAKAGPVFAYAEQDNGGRLIATRSTMAALATAMEVATKRAVVDKTGLKGYYDFDVKWSGTEAADGQRPIYGQFGGAEFVGGLISALQRYSGLRVTSAIGPVEYWIVDNVEPPTPN